MIFRARVGLGNWGGGVRGKGDPSCLPPPFASSPPIRPTCRPSRFLLSGHSRSASRLYTPSRRLSGARPNRREGGEARESPAASRDAGPRPFRQRRAAAGSLCSQSELGTRRARAAATGGCRPWGGEGGSRHIRGRGERPAPGNWHGRGARAALAPLSLKERPGLCPGEGAALGMMPPLLWLGRKAGRQGGRGRHPHLDGQAGCLLRSAG